MSATQILLERDPELELLSDLLAETRASEGRVVLIRGEAGIGKTSLVREFLARHRDDANVLFGACDDLLTPQALAPFWDIARTEHSLLAPLEKGDRQSLLAAVLDLLERSLRPTVLVIEDTQWADEATLDAIKYLGRRVDQTHGLMILTYRDTEVDHDHPLRGVIGELPPKNLVRVQLKGLSAEAVATMIGTTTSRDISDIVALTDGNPLFVSEMARTAAEEVPLSVRDSVLARAAKLSLKARDARHDLCDPRASGEERSRCPARPDRGGVGRV